MPHLWKINCTFTLFYCHVSNETNIIGEKQKELSEWKAMYIIHDYFRVLYRQIQDQSKQLMASFLRLFHLLDKMDENHIGIGRKRYLIF